MEDELHLRKNIKKFLTLKGYNVDDFENGGVVLDSANLNDYDCMILDVNTPEVDGFELLEYMRKSEVSTPAIFISALTDAQKVLKAFELGAEDYLKKPFDLIELEARMIRMCSDKFSKNEVHIDKSLVFDLEKRQLLKDGAIYKLSSTQKKCLYLLVKNINTLVTFDTLIDYVWEGKDISHNTIVSTIRYLKQLMPDVVIKNVKGEGYIFELSGEV
jgi:DNA-binding response OmpR family regulator